MATTGQRGKWAEGKFRGFAAKRSDAEAAFFFYRFPDARAGSFQVVPADFMVIHNGAPMLIEVKEVAHAYRLPAKNFSADKVARMAKFQMAGGECWVLVCHMPEKAWRLVPLDAFTGARVPSWDLSRFPVIEFDDAMINLFGVAP